MTVLADILIIIVYQVISWQYCAPFCMPFLFVCHSAVSGFHYFNENSAINWGLPWWLSSIESTCNAGDTGLIPGSGRLPGEGNGNPLQCSCLGNPMDRGVWWAIVHVDYNELDRTEIYLHHFTITLQRFGGSGGMV